MGDSEKFDILKVISKQAVLEFEELKTKCKDFSLKYSIQHDKNQKLEAQFKQLKKVSLLAVSEYENLSKHHTDQTKLREEAEAKLKKVEEENKELRKANKISPNVSIIPTNSNQGLSDGATKGELEGLKSLLNGMKDEIRSTKTEKSRIEKQLEDEKRDHDVTKKHLNAVNSQFQQLSRVSDMALEESKELRTKYEAEVACRKKAEEYATQVLHDNQTMVRKSKMVNDASAPNEKMANALKEIDDLSSTLSKERTEHAKKIKDLEEELSSLKDTQTVKALEAKLSVSCDQVELLQSQVQESEDRARQSERRARDLYDKLVRTEEALLSGGQALPEQVPFVPPPPPPPPPPMPAPVLRKFITRIGIGKKKSTLKEKDKEDPVQDMMKEMMARIQKGTHLKSSKPAKDDGSAPAMNELASLLTNLKRGQNGQEKPAEEAPKTTPEFQKFKLKKVSVDKERVKSDEQKLDSELMRKLGKQKLVAEGGDEKDGQSTSNLADSEGPPQVLERQIKEVEKIEEESQQNNVSTVNDVSVYTQEAEKKIAEIGGEESSNLENKDEKRSKEDDGTSRDVVSLSINGEIGNEDYHKLKEEALEIKTENTVITTNVKEAGEHVTEEKEEKSTTGEASGTEKKKEDLEKSLDDIIDAMNELLD